MSDTQKTEYDLKALAEGVFQRPAPESCGEIAELLSALPMTGSLGTPPPTAEQKRAFLLIGEKMKDPTPEELRFFAEVALGKYHRVRKDGEICRFMPERAEALYRRCADGGDGECAYIVGHFEEFRGICGKILSRKQRKDDFELYVRGTPTSTSRDPDSPEWKK